jgi:hypothetical protein
VFLTAMYDSAVAAVAKAQHEPQTPCAPTSELTFPWVFQFTDGTADTLRLVGKAETLEELTKFALNPDLWEIYFFVWSVNLF